MECLWAAGLLLVAAWFYFWTATSAGSPFTGKLQPDDLYNRLADGFLSGRLSFIESPDPALAQLADPWDPAQNAPYAHFHDVSYYEGHYYLCFGPAPAVLLLVPWRALTGSYLGQNVATVIFAWLGAAMGMALVVDLRRRHFPALPGWMAGLCFTVVAFGNFVPVLLRRPLYYELAIASASALVMTSLLSVHRAQRSGTRRRLWLALAGTAYGLVIACRPNYLFGSIILLTPFLPGLRDWWACEEVDWRAMRQDALAAVGPFAAVLAALCVYNWLRFGDVREFGYRYQLSGLHPQRDVVTTFRFLPVNLWFYLCSASQWTDFFPFFDVIHLPWFKFPAGYTGEENVYGILPNLPFLWMLLLLLRARQRSTLADGRGLLDFLRMALVLVSLNVLVLARVGGAASRYMVDFIPPLVPLACVGVFWAESTFVGFWRLGSRLVWVGALLFTVAFNLCVSVQHNDLLKFYNPSAYHRLAHAFDRIPDALGETAPDKVGPLVIRLKFPSGRTGMLEPLVVTGLSFRADFIYVYYADDHHLQIGFEHTSYGGPLTKPPLAVDYSVPHLLELDLGSLYPPLDDPGYDAMLPVAAARLKHTLRVVLDGTEFLSGTYDFYDASPGDVSVGHNPVSDAFGRRFTGEILRVERLGMPVRK
jgi:hypothetical protein